jgi:hypothetical protein
MAHVGRIKFTGKRSLDKSNDLLLVTARERDGLNLNESIVVQASNDRVFLGTILGQCVIEPIVVSDAKCGAKTLSTVHRDARSQGLDKLDFLDAPNTFGMKHHASRFRDRRLRASCAFESAAEQTNVATVLCQFLPMVLGPRVVGGKPPAFSQ